MTWAEERGCRAQPRRQGSEPGSAVLRATVTLCTGQLPAFPGGPLCATTNEPVPSTGVVQGGGAYSAQRSLPVLRGPLDRLGRVNQRQQRCHQTWLTSAMGRERGRAMSTPGEQTRSGRRGLGWCIPWSWRRALSFEGGEDMTCGCA